MTLDVLVMRISKFAALSYTDKVRIFMWHIHTHQRRERIAPSDLTACFDALHIPQPANISQILRQLVDKSEVLKDRQGHRLSRPLRERYDAQYGSRIETVEVDQLLSSLPASLPHTAQQEYLAEAIACFRHGAFRAAIVMTWNVAYDHLLTVVAVRSLAGFNNQMATMFGGKKKAVTSKFEFQRLKESEVIEVCNAGSIISKEVAKVLNDKLDKRNSAAHPSGSTIDKLQAEAYISDLIKNGMLKIV